MKIIPKYMDYLNASKYINDLTKYKYKAETGNKINKLPANTEKVMPITNAERIKQLNIFNNTCNSTIPNGYGLRLTKKQIKEIHGRIDWKTLNRRAKIHMNSICPYCVYKSECTNYMNVDHWIEIYTELDKNGKPWQRTCSDFHHIGMGRKKRITK